MTTTDTSTLQHLLTRVEGATGPDFEIDGTFALLEGWTFEKMKGDRAPYWRRPRVKDFWNRTEGPPKVSGSIDATLALVERLLPGANCTGYDKTPNEITAYVSRNCVPRDDKDVWLFEGVHKTSIPLAILAALLKALIAQAGVSP